MSKSITLTLPTQCIKSIELVAPEFLEQFDSSEEDGLLSIFEIYDLPESGALEHKEELLSLKVPYDLMVEESSVGEEYDPVTTCVRYSQKSICSIDTFKGRRQSVTLNSLVEAYKTGELHKLIRDEHSKIMSWDDQISILDIREQAKTALLEYDQDTLDDLVYDMAEILGGDLDDSEDGDKQLEHRHQLASSINNQGKEKQSEFLALHGHLPEPVKAHNISALTAFIARDTSLETGGEEKEPDVTNVQVSMKAVCHGKKTVTYKVEFKKWNELMEQFEGEDDVEELALDELRAKHYDSILGRNYEFDETETVETFDEEYLVF